MAKYRIEEVKDGKFQVQKYIECEVFGKGWDPRTDECDTPDEARRQFDMLQELTAKALAFKERQRQGKTTIEEFEL